MPLFVLVAALFLFISQDWLPRSVEYHNQFYDQMLGKQLDSVGEGLIPMVLAHRIDEIRDLLEELRKKNQDWRELLLSDSTGRKLYQFATDKTLPEGDVDAYLHHIMIDGELIGTIRVKVDHGRINREFKSNQLILVWVLGGMLGVFIVALGVVLEIVIRRPIGTLARASLALAGGNYRYPLPAARADEIGGMVKNFAAMRDAVESHQNALRCEIAERIKAQEETQAANGRFRLLVEQDLVGFYILQDGKVAYANPYLLERVGEKSDTIGAPMMQWVHPDDRAMVAENIQKRLGGEVSRIHYSCRLLRKDGSALEVDALGMVSKFEGRPAIIGVLLDVSEKKYAELALKKSEAFLRTLFDTAGEGIWVIDFNCVTVKSNRAMMEMLGIDESEFLYRSIFDFVDQENAAIVRAKTEYSQSGGAGQRYEVTLLRPDGGSIICQFHTAPLFDEVGNIMGAFALVSDITERKRVEAELRKLSEALEARVLDEAAKSREKDLLLIQQSRFAAMGEMIGNIAHQWRQPLNALGILLGNIKDAWKFKELTSEYMQESVGTGWQLIQKMSTTIDDFRNFFKPNREKVIFNLRSSVEEALSLVETSLVHHSIEVLLESGGDVMALGFPNEFSQVLLNIIGNAKDALLEREIIPGRISIRLDAHHGQAHVTIADNGGGIPEAILEKIFDPYFTTREKGTGIGLYMSKMIVENNMNGLLTVRNVGDGAEFEIIVPMVENATST
ncbi:MAG: PAS domain S-box protein [Sulfuricella sp.]|nr:PAS domain S-box protein [Sulfuricella sp.]